MRLVSLLVRSDNIWKAFETGEGLEQFAVALQWAALLGVIIVPGDAAVEDQDSQCSRDLEVYRTCHQNLRI
jgi:hypothetical protein